MSRNPVNSGFLISAAIMIACTVGATVLVERLWASETLIPCWACALTLFTASLIMLLAIFQQAAFSVASMKALQGAKSHVGFWTPLSITLVSSFVNSVAPAKAGTLLRGVLFKRHLRVPYTEFIGSQAALTSIGLVIALPFAFGAGINIALNLGGGEFLAILILLVFAILALAWVVGTLPLLRKEFLEKGKQVFDAFFRPLHDRDMRIVVPAFCVLQFGLVATRASVALFLVTGEYSLVSGAYIGGALILAPAIAVLPGGAGTRELMFTTGGFAAGIPLEFGLGAALVDRAFGTAALMACALPAGWHIAKQAKR